MRFFRNALVGLSIAVLALPVALVATFLLMPLWSAIESSTGIESVGHSGPAGWCFVATWIVSLCSAIGATVLLRRARARAKATAPASSAGAGRDSPPAH